MLTGIAHQGRFEKQARPLNQILLLRDQCRTALNNAALIEESTQPHVQEIGKCLQGFCQPTRRTGLQPVLPNELSSLDAAGKKRYHTI